MRKQVLIAWKLIAELALILANLEQHSDRISSAKRSQADLSKHLVMAPDHRLNLFFIRNQNDFELESSFYKLL